MKETVIITGAHGFLGRNIAHHLNEQGYLIIGIGHGHWDPEQQKLWGIDEWFQTDITYKNLKSIGSESYALVHCAGSGSVSHSLSHPLNDFLRTVETTGAVLEYVRLCAPGCRVVYPSSAAVYGSVKCLPIPETTVLSPVSPYGVHKRMAEMLCQSYSRFYSLQTAIVRFFSVYGRGLEKQILWDACSKFSKDDRGFFGTGGEIRDFLHVNDAATLIEKSIALASQEVPVMNGGSGNPTTINEVISYIAGVMNIKEKPIFSNIERKGDPLGYLADITRATSIGWKPTISWEDGIKDYIRWFLGEI